MFFPMIDDVTRDAILRDFFAAAALHALIPERIPGGEDFTAALAYTYADAMLRERAYAGK